MPTTPVPGGCVGSAVVVVVVAAVVIVAVVVAAAEAAAALVLVLLLAVVEAVDILEVVMIGEVESELLFLLPLAFLDVGRMEDFVCSCTGSSDSAGTTKGGEALQ